VFGYDALPPEQRNILRRLFCAPQTRPMQDDYVAATRARDLLWVAVPHNSLKDLRSQFLARGFKEVGTAATPAPAAKSMSEAGVSQSAH